uniref:Cytochrome c oxidase subunit 3 n=1 Tax=Harpactocrates apennicola TaxID=1110479 RepID=A0A516IMD3_9ARAC|nr:cytochrome c oxidase subunit III [Harpactocrates apennicola]QDP17922.1 cytochrome c oxidase subunit 3 [Harpactocrates apennicola]
MVNKVFQPYHIVNISPWPLIVSFNVMVIVLGLINVFVASQWTLWFTGMLGLLFCVVVWWRDVIRESMFQGCHNSLVLSGLMVGMVLFILSEVFFFISFFWSYFHFSLSPGMEVGANWPPTGVSTFNPFGIPLLNTIILLASGVSVTYAHQSILSSKTYTFSFSLLLTWILGLYFLSLQMFEYFSAFFDMSFSVYGSVFFMATGFHGFHVLVGSLFLMTMWVRAMKLQFSSTHHFGFEAAAWYWHFVDVVWLFLFSSVYWWGS